MSHWLDDLARGAASRSSRRALLRRAGRDAARPFVPGPPTNAGIPALGQTRISRREAVRGVAGAAVAGGALGLFGPRIGRGFAGTQTCAERQGDCLQAAEDKWTEDVGACEMLVSDCSGDPNGYPGACGGLFAACRFSAEHAYEQAKSTCNSAAAGCCDSSSGCGPCEHCDPVQRVCVAPPECGRCAPCDAASGTCKPVACAACETCDPATGGCVAKTCGPCETCRPSTGACGPVCGSDEVCVDGACHSKCPAGQVACAGICVDLSANPGNCGSCGHACAAGQICSGGTCLDQDCCSDAEKAQGKACCGGTCTDLGTPENCSTCGDVCTGADMYCTALYGGGNRCCPGYCCSPAVWCTFGNGSHGCCQPGSVCVDFGDGGTCCMPGEMPPECCDPDPAVNETCPSYVPGHPFPSVCCS